MKADALFVLTCIIFIFVAWVVTGGPTRAISTAGPFITPITVPGERAQGYRITAPPNTAGHQLPNVTTGTDEQGLPYERYVPGGSATQN